MIDASKARSIVTSKGAIAKLDKMIEDASQLGKTSIHLTECDNGYVDKNSAGAELLRSLGYRLDFDSGYGWDPADGITISW